MSPRVVVIGGGPAGATTALVLARLGLAVVVLEASGGPRLKPGECLPPSLSPLLDRLELRQRLVGEQRPSYGTRSLWGSQRAVDEDFLFGGQGPGLHVDRCRFEAELCRAARESGVDWRYGVRVRGAERANGGWILETRDEAGRLSRLTADFLVDASGRQACLARTLGGRRVRYDRLVGLTVMLAGKGIEDSFVLVEAVESGWWYSAALTDGRLAVAYMTDADLLPASGVRRPGEWSRNVAQLTLTRERIERHCGALDLAGERLRALPAESSRLSSIVGDGWLCVGDTAAAFDPLSSYGISSAMGSGYYAARAVHDHLDGRRDALLAYVHILEKAYAGYLRMIREGYDAERRWPEAPFWKRRHNSGRPVKMESQFGWNWNQGFP